MNHHFFKFPPTPHLENLGVANIRGDKVMSEAEQSDFLQHELTVEEKGDGASLGISFDADGNLRTQNRGAYLDLPESGQWKKLDAWLNSRTDYLFEQLTDQYILFGEWCYARHSVFYNRLPDWFLGFDIYDREAGRFLSVSRRNLLFQEMDIAPMPMLAGGRFNLATLRRLLSDSKLGDQPAEGLYLRWDNDQWLKQRAKLVRATFAQSIEEHWSRSAIKPNRLLSDARR